ncbi:ABC transporter ATP-binding protein [Catellicoccus marimammalium]|uniref:Putative hemin import ATP-binding protein HrtA n=1 Tax=Catellicoccus marimammalium M35/04/3 TaxID=1234409 RepID=K8ZP32_9ENTE|nr:ABC transporter ATP-binding protein [Catellicoccus marimammalium]EKU27346.1 ABC transporter ATP-binding protein [Catellicoccus marimammalium M35/04/3]
MSTIELKQVSKQFYDGDTVIQSLKPTDFSADNGEFIAVIGPSGSGKSTFLTIVGGLQTPTEGEVIINGTSFQSLSEKKRSKLRFENIGFILQSSNLVPFLTIYDQFVLMDKVAKKKTDPKQLEELLTQLEIAHLQKKYPEEISGGERQRVAIAKALYHNPSVILADEPTASLDSKRAFEVANLLAKETHEKNKTTIMVTHDTRLIDLCDKVYMMKDGVLTLQEKEA